MHTLIPSDNQRSGIDPSHTQAIKRWVAEILHLSPDDLVTVMESSCVDPGYPLVETTIAVFSAEGPTSHWKLTRQRYAIAKIIVHQALSQPSS
ncbi:MAG: hypothetical protein J6386_02195 [Candidatus Synoicihabitans palmerolidicus]|nr:hypothetical protein [Candidatus Synoicihabitans palmerolidicus]